jgi:hypothetical protein
MARLRNRQVKATFWTDGELLRWPRDKRTTYQGLWAVAEDSGCLEDDPFEWKLALWGSPLDTDITIDLLATWRDELIAVRKLIPYEADGKRYLFVTNFHQHEHPRNPQSPDLPLPPWVSWTVKVVVRKDGRENRFNLYEVDTELLTARLELGTDPKTAPQKVDTNRQHVTGSVPTQRQHQNGSPVLSCPDQSCPVQSIPVGGDSVGTEVALDAFAGIDFGDEEPGDEPEPEKPQNGHHPDRPITPSPPSEKNTRPDPPPETAQTIVAFAADHEKVASRTVTKARLDRIGAAAKRLLEAGADPDRVKAAVARLLDENKPPGDLEYLVGDSERGGRNGARGRTRIDSGRSENGEW